MTAAPEPTPIRIVTATRLTRERFLSESLLGRSLRALRGVAPMEISLHAENRAGLPVIYNREIDRAVTKPALLVFVHDDVMFCDFHWALRLREGLQRFGVIGLAGNRRRAPGQPAWAFVDDRLTWDDRTNLSGVVGHGSTFPPPNVSVFGPPGVEVRLLDGLLLAANSSTLLERGLRFDERFDFHFYDMDFCRSAEQLGVSLGTWPLAVVHGSGGNFRSEGWKAGLARYRAKWAD